MKQKPWPKGSLKLTQREPCQSTWPVSCFAPARERAARGGIDIGNHESKCTGVQWRAYSRSMGGTRAAGVPASFSSR